MGKTAQELREALQAEVKLINVESEAELRLLSDIAVELGVSEAACPTGSVKITSTAVRWLG